MSTVIHTRRVYPNGDYVDNGVREEDLADHTKYNLTFRFGCAFIVNGKVKSLGYHADEQSLKKHTDNVIKYSKPSPYPYK